MAYDEPVHDTSTRTTATSKAEGRLKDISSKRKYKRKYIKKLLKNY